MQVEVMLITSPEDPDLGQICFLIAPAGPSAVIRADSLGPLHGQSCAELTLRHIWVLSGIWGRNPAHLVSKDYEVKRCMAAVCLHSTSI